MSFNRIRAVLRTLAKPFAIWRKIVLYVPRAPAFLHDQGPRADLVTLAALQRSNSMNTRTRSLIFSFGHPR
jgi:hypothetical protein